MPVLELILLGAHGFVLVGVAIWRMFQSTEKIATIWQIVLGLPALVVIALTGLFLFDFRNHPHGGPGVFFLIYALMSLGVVPLLTFSSAGVCGYIFGRFVRTVIAALFFPFAVTRPKPLPPPLPGRSQ